MLEKKVLGLLITTGEGLTIEYICSLTNEKKDVILKVANKLVKKNKAEWRETKK